MAIKESSYGIVPLCKQGEQWMVFLIQHGRAKYWGFPKGHAEIGETPKEAAIRELFEETNLTVVRFLSETTQEEHYSYTLRGQLINKTVSYFVAEVEGIVQLQQEEVGDGQWFGLKQAITKLTYEIDKSVLSQAVILVGLS